MTSKSSRAKDAVVKNLASKILSKLGYKKLTEIQVKSIPLVLKCRNVLIIAPTGSGKTEAALLPIIISLIIRRLSPISVLYITPLRALNRDIFRRLIKLCSELGITVDIRHGDTPYRARKKIERNPPQILITTPETFSYILICDKLRDYLRNVEWVIIDEYHELISSKRGTQLLLNISRLEHLKGRSVRKIALSASLGNVDKAAELLSPSRDVCKAVVPGIRESEIKVINVTSYCSYLSNGGSCDKVGVIADIIRKYRKVLVFVNTRDEAEWLGSRLNSLGINVRVHHGSLSRKEREEVEYLLREGLVNAVIATSSLELGIDIGDIDLVIQVSSPKQAVKLLQRIGRSLHGVGTVARGVIVTDDLSDDILESIVLARRVKAGNIEDPIPFTNSLDVLAHAVVGMALESNGIDINELYDVITKSVPYRDLSYTDYLKLIDFLNTHGLVKLRNSKVLPTGKGRLYYLRTTMIVDTGKYSVINAVTNEKIGDLDEDFIALNVEQGKSLVLGGRVWTVLSIDDEGKRVFVEPLNVEEAIIPSWTGETIPVDYRVAREVCRLRVLIGAGHIPSYYVDLISNDVLRTVRNILRSHLSKGYVIPHDNNVTIEIIRGKRPLIILHTCLGTKGNRGLGILISYLISKYLGTQPLMKIDAYRVIIEVPMTLSEGYVANVLSTVIEDLRGSNVRNLILEAVRSTKLYDLVVSRVLSRLGIVSNEMPRNIVKTLVRRYRDVDVISAEALNEVMTKYVDIDAVMRFIDVVTKGNYRLYIINEPSPLASEGLKLTIYYDRIKSQIMPKNVIIELMKRKIMSKEVTLVCMSCGYLWKSKVADLPERVKCPRCGLSLIALSNLDVNKVREIVRKGKEAGFRYKFVLSDEERKIFEKLIDIAKLVLIYGKRAVMALSCRGVGVNNAKQALSVFNDNEFFLKLYELERNYLRTRKYWH